MKRIKLLVVPLVVLVSICSLVYIQIVWAATTDLTQQITAGTLSVDIVDAGGVSVGSPSVAFESKAFSFSAQDSTGTLGVSAQRIRLSNPTATAEWTVSMAATGGVSSTWTAGSFTYPYNAAAADNGRLTVNPGTSTNITGVDGCATTNISTGAQAFFLSGTTDSVTLMSAASGASVGCRWDLMGVVLTQRIPASQTPASNYTLNMTISAL